MHYSMSIRSSRTEVFLKKGALKICSRFTGEHPCRSVISITFRHGCSPVNLLHVFRTPFFKNTSGRLLLFIFYSARLSSNSYWEKNISCLSSPSEVFLRKDVLKICSKFAKQLYWNCTSVRVFFLQICCIFSEHLFLKNILGGLLLYWQMNWSFE